MRFRNVVDKFHNQHSLADTGTTEETNLATLRVRGKQIDDLDTGNENLLGSALLNKLGGFLMNRVESLGIDGTALIDRLANDVDNATERRVTDRDPIRRPEPSI